MTLVSTMCLAALMVFCQNTIASPSTPLRSSSASPFAPRGPASQAQNEPIQWHTGSALNRALAKRVSVSWGRELRETLLGFSQQQQVAIYMDRRVDPNQILKFQCQSQRVDEVLYSLADHLDAGVCRLGDVFYVGPRDRVALLIALREQLISDTRNMHPKLRQELLRRQPISWGRLSEPTQILNELKRQAPVAITGPQLPHDLWPAYQLPSMSLLDRLSLAIFGFDLWFSIASDGSAELVLKPAPSVDSFTQTMRTRISPDQIAILKREFPDTEIGNSRQGVTVSGTPIDLYNVSRQLAKLSTGSNHGAPAASDTRIGINTTASIGAILKKIASQIGVDLKYDPSLVSALKQRITINQQPVTREVLIQRVLESTGLEFELTDSELIIKRNN